MVALPLYPASPPAVPPSASSSRIFSGFHHWKTALGISLAMGAGVGLRIVPHLSKHRSTWAAALLEALSSPKNLSCLLGTAISPLACLSLSAEAPPAQRLVMEPKTGMSFPLVLDEKEKLAGMGLRKKTLLGLKNVTVYAFGIYADEGSLREKLGSKYIRYSTTQLQQSKEFYQDIITSDSNLTVRLVIVYGRLKIGSVRSAFEESIGSRIKKFTGTKDDRLLQSFTSIFKDDIMLPRGTTLDIARHPGHILQTKIDGKEIGCVQSPLLCRAVFDLYIGEEPFDKKGREEIGLGLASLLLDSSS
eukprot:c17744_g1_i1 orf=332-1243(-)